MRILLFTAVGFSWQPRRRVLSTALGATADPEEGAVGRSLVAFIEVETADDRDTIAEAIREIVRRLEGETVVLHSFSHLYGDPSEPRTAAMLLAELAEGLRAVGVSVRETPFGWKNDWVLRSVGESGPVALRIGGQG